MLGSHPDVLGWTKLRVSTGATRRSQDTQTCSSDAPRGRRAIKHRLRVNECVALHVPLELPKVIAWQERAEQLAVVVQDNGHGRIELAQVLAHPRHEILEGLPVR